MTTITQVPASEIRVGDLIDLEGDEYADHLHEPCEMCVDRNPDLFKMEFQEVRTVNHETPDCVAIGFDFDVVGFPTWHLLSVVERRGE